MPYKKKKHIALIILFRNVTQLTFNFVLMINYKIKNI